MIDQLSMFEHHTNVRSGETYLKRISGTVRLSRAQVAALKLALPAEPLEAPRDRAQFVRRILTEYVAAVSSERSCRCRGKAALEASETAIDGAAQLATEGRELLERAGQHQARAERLALQLTQHVQYPLPPETTP